MNVSLTLQLEHFVRENVSRGTYKSASAVVRDALRLLQETEWQRRDRETNLEVKARELKLEIQSPLVDEDHCYDIDSRGGVKRSKMRSR